MSTSSIGIATWLNSNLTTSSQSSQKTTSILSDMGSTTSANQTMASATDAVNNSSLSAAIQQALAQVNAGADLTSLLPQDSQQASSDFMGNLLAALPMPASLSSSSANSLPALSAYTSAQAGASVALNQSSPTIKLQTAIQKLISQLDSNSNSDELPGTEAAPGLGNLKQSFNQLITSSGGNPSEASLQSFLKTVALNVQHSVSIGSLLDASA